MFRGVYDEQRMDRLYADPEQDRERPSAAEVEPDPTPRKRPQRVHLPAEQCGVCWCGENHDDLPF